ncbi:MAG: adenine deaminase [Desulfovibrio sp.]|nr:adenine deaminase [Desulfovibrio sp.]
MIDAISHRIRMTLGEEACDLAITHVHVVDVLNCDVTRNATVLAGGGVVLAVLPGGAHDDICAREVVDGGGRFLTPGLTDAHIHIESTMLTPDRFAAAVLPFGTTRVIADPHEIANVAGIEGLRYMLDASRRMPMHMHIALPSCVPCTPFEDAGATLTADDLLPFMDDPCVCSLGEVMNCPGVMACDVGLLAKIKAAVGKGLVVDGHCPTLRARQLAAYSGCGVGNDHECSTPEGLRAKIAAGLYVFIRHGSAASSLESLLPGVTPGNIRRCCLCTDDMHAGDILRHGHINHVVARAVALGIPAPMAVSMATLNPAQAYGFNRVGAIAPGYSADFCLVDDLRDFHVAAVWCDGKKIAERGRLLEDLPRGPLPETLCSRLHVKDFSEEQLRIPLQSRRARVIVIHPGSLNTEKRVMDIDTTAEGDFSSELNPGLCKIAVVERHKGHGHVGLGILAGYAKEGTTLGGAIATSISHDSHNIVVAGSNDEDMIAAVREVCAMNGGIALLRDGRTIARLPLPVGGLMSPEDAVEVARLNETVNAAAAELSVSKDVDPVITLAFMSLCVIPSIKVSTKGLFDVDAWRFVDIEVR